MLGSPFAKGVLTELQKWEQQLQTLQTLLDELLSFQGSWQYVEPIFSSPGVGAQMPSECKQFARVDGLWRVLMAHLQQHPGVLDLGTVTATIQSGPALPSADESDAGVMALSMCARPHRAHPLLYCLERPLLLVWRTNWLGLSSAAGHAAGQPWLKFRLSLSRPSSTIASASSVM